MSERSEIGSMGFPARLRRTSDATHAIFADPASRAFEERLALLAPTDVTVLITGETGTGKEVVARELHARSKRRAGRFLAVNCGALSESLAEAELFGHEKGAFTGALRAQPGWFEAADGGTLLLDEVGELPLPMQVRLLRVLQEREVTRVGSRTGQRLDVRIVAATNVDLEAAVAKGTFRKDLLFRLNVATVHLRPLRERRQDIEPLARHFLALYGERFARPGQSFSDDALDLLCRYDWPGNVRELDNVVHRAVLLHAGDVIRAADLSISVAAPPEPAAPRRADDGTDLEAAMERLAREWINRNEPELLPRAMRALVQAGFRASGDNQVRAAELLGVSRNTLRTQLAHLGVIAPRRRAQDPAGRGLVRLRIGVQQFGSSSLLRFGSDLERRLAAQGILVDWRSSASGMPLLEALNEGAIDFCGVGEVPPLFAQAQGAPLLYMAYEPPAPGGVGIVVRSDSPFRAMPDLRGRRIALSRGSNTHILLLRALEMHGLSFGDIEPVYLPNDVPPEPGRPASADAWLMWDPFLSAIELQGEFRVLLDGTGLVANHQFYIASRSFAEALPDVAEIVLDEARRVGAEAAQRPAEAAQRLAEAFGMAPEGVEIAMRRLSHGARRLDRTVVSDQQRIADRLYALGMLRTPIMVSEAVLS
jgi:DNA-binding NtrC family response regulator/ABC-type nitrate/sulfonate/bicarbonate transport system substrate-binding protein